jgi:acyl carrier protein
MTPDALKTTVLAALNDIAPEVDPATIQSARKLRDQLDLDSMDWLRFLGSLEKKLSVTVPDADARKLFTVDDIVRYLAQKL